MPTPLNLEPILSFLEELSQNNHKAWFDAHRPTYITARDTFEQLITDFIDEFRASDRLQGLTARECIGRIYRDVRFTKDKSPYKTNMGAMIAPGGWKGASLGYYISIEPGGQSMVAGGLYAPTSEQLNRFRQVVARDATEFKKLTSTPDFIEAFGGISGERLKTAPQGYDRNHPEIALLQLKQITIIHRFSREQVVASAFAQQVAQHCRTMRPFLDYLDDILR